MCANYLPSRRDSIERHFGVAAPLTDYPEEAYPGYLAPIVRLSDDGSDEMESVAACFGMVPQWADMKLARQTYNARSETVASKPSFRHAFTKRQFCIIPAAAIYEPSYETGRAVRWKIEHAQHEPLGIAGIWEWRAHGGPNDQPLVSFSMLTINADQHPLMRRFHKPDDEKRMVVVIAPDRYQDWLHASAENAADFFQPIAAEELAAQAAPRAAAKKTIKAPRHDDLFAGL